MEPFEVVRRGLLEDLTRIVEANPTIIHQVELRWNRTLLHTAALHGHTHLVQYLLGAGADINQTDQNLHTALALATWKGCTGTVHALLTAGADIEIKDRNGCTPVMLAVRWSRVEAAALLMRAGAIMTFRDENGLVGASRSCENSY
eukprot:c17357_g1_i4.p1 GENE.c17357_g1_i4~~c17357_g1_i4.p1  ORF type:complete len:146 (+),score=11.84 c17357_g1_i4:46-483(+)